MHEIPLAYPRIDLHVSGRLFLVDIHSLAPVENGEMGGEIGPPYQLFKDRGRRVPQSNIIQRNAPEAEQLQPYVILARGFLLTHIAKRLHGVKQVEGGTVWNFDSAGD